MICKIIDIAAATNQRSKWIKIIIWNFLEKCYKLQNLKVAMISIIVGALGMNTKNLKTRVGKRDILEVLWPNSPYHFRDLQEYFDET